MKLLTFEAALADAEQFAAQPHVLLGNGFSIACRPDRFTYGALLDEVTFDGAPINLHEIFWLLETTDFEQVVGNLRRAADLCQAYGADADTPTTRSEVLRSA